ncbi:hypothetical protein [Mangrovibacterium sp.]|uniref:hypothetical protein n=1 Tax=Mangrovibacterium sp. TaxID=1961364 RepID=UPI0035698C9C
MLNYNKIDSTINFQRTPKTAIAEHLGIPESTLRSRLERKNLTPDDVEAFADFFSKPIAFFFDKEENEVNEKPETYKLKIINCPECIKKQKELDDYRQKYIECLEELAGRQKKTS